MSSPPASSSTLGGSRRSRLSRSPSTGVAPPSKRSKPSSSGDAAHASDQQRLYTSICVKNINPKISDLEVRELCDKKFSKYGTNSVKIYYKNQERVAFVNFTNCEDARKARHAKTGLMWESIQVVLEPVYYRRTVPAEQPITPGSPRDRSPPSPKRRRRRQSPSPPPVTTRIRSPRHHRTSSPPRSRRTYSPYIPLPPDLINYVSQKPGKKKSESASTSPSPVRNHQRHQSPSKSRSRSPSLSHSSSPPRAYKNRSKTEDPAANRTESNVQHEPTRTLFVGNLERDIKESKIREIFGRYGAIEEVDLKVPQSSSKRAYAFIQYENMDMAYEARRKMDGHFIGKADCKIGYGKIVPTNCLWVGNISMDIKRRDLEQAFARYGEFKSFDYSTGDPAAIVTYNEIEDAIKARAKMTGVIRINDGQKVRAESGGSDSSRRAGFRIDYLDRPTARRFVIVRPQETTLKRRKSRSSSASSGHSRSSKDRQRSISPEQPVKQKSKRDLKQISSESRSPSPTKRRSPTPPAPGRTFHGPVGSYLSSNETKSITNINELMNLCEKLNRSTAAVYPVEFILKQHAYPARMHFLAGNPNLAKTIIGEPGDRNSNRTELKLTQRLRLDQDKLEELEKKFCAGVSDILNNSQSSSSSHRKATAAFQTKFSILITSTKAAQLNGRNKSPEHSSTENNERSHSKKGDDDESSLSRFISYLASKDAAGVITMPLSSDDTDSAVLHIFPPCQFSKKILEMICPSISFSNGPHTPPSRPTTAINDEHLMLVIAHSD